VLLVIIIIIIIIITNCRWSAGDAVDYLVRLSGVSRSKADLDVRRIITFPGQAVAPEYGRLKLDTLRRLAQSVLGIVYWSCICGDDAKICSVNKKHNLQNIH